MKNEAQYNKKERKGYYSHVIHHEEVMPIDKPNIVKELTPQLAYKICKSVQKSLYDERVSKDMVLHHLKQLKAQMGKKAKYARNHWKDENGAYYIEMCMEMIDKKIAKINKI